jgi:hypothetical protein
MGRPGHLVGDAEMNLLGLDKSPLSGPILSGKENPMALTTEDRFWRMVDRRGPQECWEWTGARHPKGYGKLGVVIDGKKVTVAAHRFSFELHHRPLLPGENACHSCDNPPCVNGAHLFAGDHQKNAEDMMRKGRGRHGSFPGEANPNARLTADAVRSIRADAATGKGAKSLGRKYGISKTQAERIVRRESWKHVE